MLYWDSTGDLAVVGGKEQDETYVRFWESPKSESKHAVTLNKKLGKLAGVGYLTPTGIRQCDELHNSWLNSDCRDRNGSTHS